MSGQASLIELVELSRYFGAKSEFVIAGGGNTSVKVGDALFVKPSGVALASIAADDFVQMNRGALAALLCEELGGDPEAREARFKEAILAARTDPQRSRRPSVECVLHNLLPAALRGAHARHEDELAHLRRAGGSRGGAPVRRRGPLGAVRGSRLRARQVRRSRARTVRAAHRAPLPLGSPDAEPRPDRVRRHARRGEGHHRPPGRRPSPRPQRGRPRKASRSGPSSASSPRKRARSSIRSRPMLRGLLADSDDAPGRDVRRLADGHWHMPGSQEGRPSRAGGPLTPDQIVYCNSFPLWFEPTAGEAGAAARRAAARGRRRPHDATTGFPPQVVLVKGLGMFAAGDDFAAAETVRLVYLDAIKVMAGARAPGRHPAPRAARPPSSSRTGKSRPTGARSPRRRTSPAAPPARWPSSPARRRASAWRSPRTWPPRAPTWSWPT